jgi:hypothetical protein
MCGEVSEKEYFLLFAHLAHPFDYSSCCFNYGSFSAECLHSRLDCIERLTDDDTRCSVCKATDKVIEASVIKVEGILHSEKQKSTDSRNRKAILGFSVNE